MGLENTQSVHQPATLHVMGHTPSSCAITHIAGDHAIISFEDTHLLSRLLPGDLAELHVHVSGNQLKIKASIGRKRSSAIALNYLNPQEASVRQLVNWFSQPGRACNFASEATVLLEIQDLAFQQLDGLLELFLEQADQRLLNLAEDATSNEQQNRIFEAKSLLRRHRQSLHQHFHDLVHQRFEKPDAAVTTGFDAQSRTLHEDMALVEREAFEDWLSLEVISRKARERYYIPLVCLSQRFGKLMHQTLTEEQLPVGVQVLCQSLQTTLKPYPINPALLPVIYRFFDETVIQHLDDLYDTLNARLKNYNILPNLESQVLRGRRHPPGASAPTAPLAAPNLPSGAGTSIEGEDTGTHIGGVAGGHGSPALYNTVRHLLELLRGPTQASSAGATIPDSQQLINGLSSLQHDPQAMAAIVEGASLNNWLQQTLNLRLTGELADMVELISGVFDTLADYPQIPAPAIRQLNRLQIPLAKMALIDPSLFAITDHPARRLMNQLIELCVKSELSGGALEKKLDGIISDITDNFQGDSRVFEHAINQLSPIIEHQDSAYQRNTARVAQTCEGRQRVQKAQAAVDREIQRRIAPPSAPDIVIELLDNGWRELLKLTYIKSGPDSASWYEHLDTLDQLLVWLHERDGTQESPDSKTTTEIEAEPFAALLSRELDTVFPGDYRGHNTIEKIRDTLQGRRPITRVALDQASILGSQSHRELQKELEAANPQLARWFKRARNLKVGDEFSYLDDETGQGNIKLAWISENHQHFVFVNNRGQKVYDYDLVDLANELARGLSPLAEKTEWPLVERSLYSTVQQAYEKLAYNSTHDELTGLINRKECERLLNNAIVDAKNSRRHHCLMYIDIDNFSLINSLHGHVAGDQLLKEVSQLLHDQIPGMIPGNTTLGRMAGNEFLILLQQSDLPQSLAFAENLRQTLEQREFQWQQHPVQFTVSVGLVIIDKFTSNVVDVLRNGISACQTAKKSGGNRVIDFRQDAELHHRREKLLSWIDKLNSVLSSDRLSLRAQSISALNNESNSQHFEILLATRNDQDELESPVEFIEAAECYNRMQRVDRWVIEKTFQWLHDLTSAGKILPEVSINLSGNSLNDDLFMDFILEQFAIYKVPTANVCFEVTETATINSLAAAADFIREVKKIGCKFSLDDFGSGNASYQYLRHLPVDFLKIDGAFVREIHKNPHDYALVKSINEIGHLMGKKTIAEFAETDEIVELLREIGVDYIQGYAISKPILLSDLVIH